MPRRLLPRRILALAALVTALVGFDLALLEHASPAGAPLALPGGPPGIAFAQPFGTVQDCTNPNAACRPDGFVSWASLLDPNVPIRSDVHWTPLTANLLAVGKPVSLRWNWVEAPQRDTAYPVSLANHLAGRDLDPLQSDIDIAFNITAPWYFGTDGKPPRGTADFVSVGLHELGHGLGFFKQLLVTEQGAYWGVTTLGYPTPFERWLTDVLRRGVVDTYPNGSTALALVLTSEALFWGGPQGAAAAGGAPPRLYAPATWEPESSVSHLDELTYRAGNLNSLMTPGSYPCEVVHHPGPIALGMLRDMGWTLRP